MAPTSIDEHARSPTARWNPKREMIRVGPRTDADSACHSLLLIDYPLTIDEQRNAVFISAVHPRGVPGRPAARKISRLSLASDLTGSLCGSMPVITCSAM
jgi:hypothetical protein